MLKRILLTFAAIPIGVGLGFVLLLPIVGAPHAFPGLLLHAPENVRNTVGLVIMFATPALLVLLVWIYPTWRTAADHKRLPAANLSLSTIPRESLKARFNKKSTDELNAILATRDKALYPASTYQLIEECLKERA
jgi:hypothetical protein